MSADQSITLGLTSIVVLGVGAQWIARRLRFPSLLLLLPAGMIAGDVLGLVDPVEVFGPSLFPLVTLLVALLLFHAGLQLDLADLPRVDRRPVLRMVLIGGAVTFVGASLTVLGLFDVSGNQAFLIGSILVVSGPTVVNPLLDVIRAREPTGTILKWESTTLDPVGATLGVVMLNLVLATGRPGLHPLWQMLGRLGLGITVGLVASALLVFVLSRYLVTDDMEAAVAVLFAVAAFGAAELVLSEAGLFATVTLGIVARNQRVVPTARITGFGETLEVLIIGILFITLGALVSIDELWSVAPQVVALVAVLVLIVRPAATALGLARTHLPWQDRTLIGCLDPRGIVAAATAAQFSGSLTAAGESAGPMLAITFGVILGTGVVYGLAAGPIGRRLGVVRPPSRGVVLVGREPWLVELGQRLREHGVPVLVLTPTDPESVVEPDGGVRIVSLRDAEPRVQAAIDEADLRVAVVVGQPGVIVSLITADLIERLGRRHVLRLADSAEHGIERTIDADWTPHPFAPGTTWSDVRRRIDQGGRIEVRTLDEVPVTKGDGGAAPPDDQALPLGLISADGYVDLRPGRRAVPSDALVLALVP